MLLNWKDEFPEENRYYETENGILYKGDCLQVIKEFPKESIDLVITDPPYLINYKSDYRKNKSHRFCKPIQNDNNYSLISEFAKHSFDVLKNNKAFYCFTSWKTIDYFKQQIEKYFKLRNLVVWVKNNWTAGDLKAQFGQQYEVILYANKGRTFIQTKRFPDVWFFDRVAGKKQLHQNQKPIGIIRRMIHASSEINDIILDPFAGSGTTALACEKLNRRWIGIEIEEEYCEIAKRRLEEFTRQMAMEGV